MALVSTDIVPKIARERPARIGAAASDSPAEGARRRTTTVLLIGEPGIPRDGLCALLKSDGALEVIAVAAGRREAVRALHAARPHVVVMDLSVDLLQGREIAHIKRRWPGVGVLALIEPGREHIDTALRAGAGADGYVLLGEECAELFNAVRRIASGRGYISPATLDRMLTSYRGSPDAATRRSALPGVLSDREREVIAMIAKGYRTREMAQLLCLSHKTVEKHRANLMRKLGLRSAAAAAAYAITHGLGEGIESSRTR
jgi:DNA-binding NarL/FixJ family response regulator